MIARKILDGSRWEADRSGYGFLTDREGKLIVYPIATQREGGFLDPVPVENSNENINQAFARIGRGDTAQMIQYPYVKPGTTERILKSAYVIPMGEYLLVSGVYIDRADKAFKDYLFQALGQLAVTLIIIGGVIVFSAKPLANKLNKHYLRWNRFQIVT